MQLEAISPMEAAHVPRPFGCGLKGDTKLGAYVTMVATTMSDYEPVSNVILNPQVKDPAHRSRAIRRACDVAKRGPPTPRGKNKSHASPVSPSHLRAKRGLAAPSAEKLRICQR